MLVILDCMSFGEGFGRCAGILGYRPGEVPRVYRLLDLAAAGRPGHVPVHLLLTYCK